MSAPDTRIVPASRELRDQLADLLRYLHPDSREPIKAFLAAWDAAPADPAEAVRPVVWSYVSTGGPTWRSDCVKGVLAALGVCPRTPQTRITMPDDVIHTYLGATTMRSFLHAAIGALTDDNGMSEDERRVTACAEIGGAMRLLDGCAEFPYLSGHHEGVTVTRTHRLVPDPDPVAALGCVVERPKEKT